MEWVIGFHSGRMDYGILDGDTFTLRKSMGIPSEVGMGVSPGRRKKWILDLEGEFWMVMEQPIELAIYVVSPIIKLVLSTTPKLLLSVIRLLNRDFKVGFLHSG